MVLSGLDFAVIIASLTFLFTILSKVIGFPDQIRKNLVNVRNGLVIKGVIPRQSGVTYTLEDKQNANETLKIKSPYIALELLAMSALMYGTTRKK